MLTTLLVSPFMPSQLIPIADVYNTIGIEKAVKISCKNANSNIHEEYHPPQKETVL